ncbi:MAG: 50S ribosomal protein L25 [Bacteroidetes bacterium]|nr:MAG: 50S ribosomal protein L25 [Bacteroidota bacterium]
MEAIAVSAAKRENLGKKATKQVRSEGRIPGVLYSKDGIVHFTTTHKALKPLIFTGDLKVASLNVDGQSYRCIVKDVQWHPVTDEIVHVDMLQLLDGQPVKLEVPIRFQGSAPGVRVGGKLQQNLRRIKIKTTPENMVTELQLNISKLELGQSARVRDIKPVDGVEIMTPAGTPVATIEIPRALRSAATAEKKAAAAAK